jgi:broad specificity phosphatase PhoE
VTSDPDLAARITRGKAGVVAENRIVETAGHRPRTDACRLYLVRHGTTTVNGENRYRGRRDIPLDVQGYQDALEAARLLCHAGLTAVYTGPLRRTIATAQIIADAARIPDVRILPWLTNLDYGLWEGMTADEAATYDPQGFELYRTSPLLAACPEGERLADAGGRMAEALRLIGSRHQGESVAAVTHAVMLRLTLLEAGGVDDRGWRVAPRNGPVTQFRIVPEAIRLVERPVE